MSVIEKERIINIHAIEAILPKIKHNSPILFEDKSKADLSEREILYKVLFDMKKDLNELKKITFDLIKRNNNEEILSTIDSEIFSETTSSNLVISKEQTTNTIEIEESLSLFEQEKKLIEKSLIKHKGKRKNVAKELGISERTLYRKIKDYKL